VTEAWAGAGTLEALEHWSVLRAESGEFDAPTRSPYRTSMRFRLLLTSAGLILGMISFPGLSAAQSAPTTTDSLIRVQLEVVPLPQSALGPWQASHILSNPLSSNTCPMPVLTWDRRSEVGLSMPNLFLTDADRDTSVPMPTLRSSCSNPLGPDRTP
jgi:hypothetical protein